MFVKKIKNYNEYLKSNWWRTVREQRLRLDLYLCALCKSKYKLHVHHITYERIGEENVFTDLITLCEKCHNAEHKRKNKRKQYDFVKRNRKRGKPGKPFSRLHRKMKKKGICVLTKEDINKEKPKEFLIKL